MHAGRFSYEVRVLIGKIQDFHLKQFSEMTDGGVRLFLDFKNGEVFWLAQSETDSFRIFNEDGSSEIFLADGSRIFTHTILDDSDSELEFQDPITDIDFQE